MKGTVYLVFAYHLPQQLQRLIETLRNGSPNAEIVLHVGASKGVIDTRVYDQIPSLHVLSGSENVGWGNSGFLRAILHCLAWVNERLDYEWIVFLSGQDYPIMPLQQIERYYRQSGYDGFISGVEIGSPAQCDPNGCQKRTQGEWGGMCPDCFGRYYYRYYNITRIFTAGMATRIGSAVLSRCRTHYGAPGKRLLFRNWPDGKRRRLLGVYSASTFSRGYRCYKGSTWFSLNRRCIGRILEETRSRPALLKHYDRTLMPDESYFQTVLYNQDDLHIDPDDKRYIMWENSSSAHPMILNKAHLDSMLRSEKHFARKFDTRVDSEVLDLLDKQVLSF